MPGIIRTDARRIALAGLLLTARRTAYWQEQWPTLLLRVHCAVPPGGQQIEQPEFPVADQVEPTQDGALTDLHFSSRSIPSE